MQKLKKSNMSNINGLFMNILDYIEFLIKFKLKTLSNGKVFFNVQNKDNQEYQSKLKFKKKIFKKL